MYLFKGDWEPSVKKLPQACFNFVTACCGGTQSRTLAYYQSDEMKTIHCHRAAVTNL